MPERKNVPLGCRHKGFDHAARTIPAPTCDDVTGALSTAMGVDVQYACAHEHAAVSGGCDDEFKAGSARSVTGIEWMAMGKRTL